MGFIGPKTTSTFTIKPLRAAQFAHFASVSTIKHAVATAVIMLSTHPIACASRLPIISHSTLGTKTGF